MLARGKSIHNVLRSPLIGAQCNFAKMQRAPLQEAALQERCILVNEQDCTVGDASKKDCHLVGRNGKLLLHRAFSVFLFNKNKELLLQKRSATKVTFPLLYTNTCCSHPLAEIPGEMEERDALGIRRAAQRRISYELGIPTDEVELNDFNYLTRIHYKDIGDGHWGENEIDYILFLQKDDLTLDPNPDEIGELRWVSKSEMHKISNDPDYALTPWFKLIWKHHLPCWWDNLDALDKFKNHTDIHHLE